MNIALYFPCDHLADWSLESFKSGNLPLSGTDSMILNLSFALSAAGNGVTLLVNSLPKGATAWQSLNVVFVENAQMAVSKAACMGCVIGIFTITKHEILRGIVDTAEVLKFPILLWAHNGPDAISRDMVASSSIVRRLIAVSASQVDCFRDHPVFYKTSVIPNFINADFWRRPANRVIPAPLRVCFLGSLTPSKGFHHLARAWPKVRKQLPTAMLEVVGSARLYDGVAKLGQLGVASPEYERQRLVPYLGGTLFSAQSRGVTFHGLLPPNKIREVLWRSAVAVVNPNCAGSLETFCLSAVEAAAASVAVIGARRQGLRETVEHNQSGILIGRESCLSDAIISLLLNPVRAAKLGDYGEKCVATRFSVMRGVAMWEELICKTLSGAFSPGVEFSISRTDSYVAAREFLRIVKLLIGCKFSFFTWAHLKRLWGGVSPI
jgi:glycosyltransferase involved in cell wall biosynthesis